MVWYANNLLACVLSASTCSLSSGLSGVGLSDVRKIIHLMNLVGSGRVDASLVPSQALTCLTACLTAIAHNDPSASRRVIFMCAQVPDNKLLKRVKFLAIIYNSKISLIKIYIISKKRNDVRKRSKEMVNTLNTNPSFVHISTTLRSFPRLALTD